MSMIEDLKNLGVDVDEGLDRVMGDHDLYEMMLGMFIGSVNDNPVSQEDFDGAGLDEAIKRIHMLKGVTGNLAMTPLFTRYTEVLGLLRSGKIAEAKVIFTDLQPIQAEIVSCIKRNTGAQ